MQRQQFCGGGNRWITQGVGSLVIVLFLVSCTLAQVDRAGLNGTTKDSEGRVLPNVRVVAVQNRTGLKRETISSANGTYDIPELPVGTYTLTFSHDGFRELSFEDVVQRLEQTRTLDAMLQVAGANEKIAVSSTTRFSLQARVGL